MPGIYGDLRNYARNSGFENWNGQTVVSTSGGDGPDLWTAGFGSGSTFILTRASTGQDTGTFCGGMSYSHANASDLHQVAALVNDWKGQTISFSARVATATSGAVRPFVSSDGGTTKTYGQYNTGAGATTYETLKVEGFAVPSGATALWYGFSLERSASIFFDSVSLNVGSAAETAFPPAGPKSASWTIVSNTTTRTFDPTAVTFTTQLQVAFATLLRDLQNAGIIG